MAAVTTAQAVTAELFLEQPSNRRAELIRGEVVEMPPPGVEHGALSAQVVLELGLWNRQHQAGVVTGEAGFILSRDPDTVRAPDACFIANNRLPHPLPRRYDETVPDLVVEVVSPSDRDAEVMAKVGAWVDSGVRVVWVVWPESRTAWVCRGRGQMQVLGHDDALAADDVLPGFALPLATLFGALAD